MKILKEKSINYFYSIFELEKMSNDKDNEGKSLETKISWMLKKSDKISKYVYNEINKIRQEYPRFYFFSM